MNELRLTRRQVVAGLGRLAVGTVAAGAAMAGRTARAGETPPASGAPSGVEHEGPREKQTEVPGEVLTRFTLREQHLRLTQVILQDQTDRHNELVQTREWLLHPSERVALQGNLFAIENVLTGQGRVLLKLEPLPHARPVQTAADLTVVPREDTGFDFALLGGSGLGTRPEEAFADLPYAGGSMGRTRALQQFQRSRSRIRPDGAVPRFVSNTWGDRSRDSRISHDFILKEIEAGARLGVEVVQIDDGWQTGISSNSVRSQGRGVWEGFWRNRPDFWVPDAVKFPQGLEPLAREAARRGMSLGLWYAPDSSDEFARWEKDAACLAGLHRTLGVRHFKIDSVHAPTALAHANLERLVAAVLAQTDGRVVLDLDVTASLRPGYFGLIGTGPLFVENRYTDRHKYWPHQTLRNLWQLAWWVDPGRLRMEFLNHARNSGKYPDDPLAPGRYTPDALFATVFFSHPLGWFENSSLPASYFEAIPPLVARWKELRGDLFSGTILPLGQAPDGVAWCGFASLAADGRSAILLAFRELNPSPDWQVRIPGLLDGLAPRCEVLAGKGRVRVAGESIEVGEVEPLGYVLVRLTT